MAIHRPRIFTLSAAAHKGSAEIADIVFRQRRRREKFRRRALPVDIQRSCRTPRDCMRWILALDDLPPPEPNEPRRHRRHHNKAGSRKTWGCVQCARRRHAWALRSAADAQMCLFDNRAGRSVTAHALNCCCARLPRSTGPEVCDDYTAIDSSRVAFNSRNSNSGLSGFWNQRATPEARQSSPIWSAV